MAVLFLRPRDVCVFNAWLSRVQLNARAQHTLARGVVGGALLLNCAVNDFYNLARVGEESLEELCAGGRGAKRPTFVSVLKVLKRELLRRRRAA